MVGVDPRPDKSVEETRISQVSLPSKLQTSKPGVELTAISTDESLQVLVIKPEDDCSYPSAS